MKPYVNMVALNGLCCVALIACSSAGNSTAPGEITGSGTGGPAAPVPPSSGIGGAAGMSTTSGNAAGTLAANGGMSGTPSNSGAAGKVADSGASAAGTSAGTGGNPASNPIAGSGGSAGSNPPSAGGGGTGTDPSPVPATGTFPKIDDPTSKGPYMPVTLTSTGPSGGYTLFHPKELAPGGALNPIVSWGNGGATTPGDYDYLLPHLASHGFVVIASNNPLVTGSEVRAGIDWIIEQSKDAASPFYQKLDVDNVSGVGYSAGGLATLSVADDPRFVTLVIISGANTTDSSRTMNTPKLHAPMAFLCTGDSASKDNCANDYAVAKVPAFFGVMNGSTHTDVTELLGLGVPAIMKRLAGATTAWLRWQQMADQSFKPMFAGADCGLCNDTNWTVEPQKNLN